jgi:hypothetical protein
MSATFEHPANDWRPAITVSWYQGGTMPRSPRPYLDLNKIGAASTRAEPLSLLQVIQPSRHVPNDLLGPITDDFATGQIKVIPGLAVFQQDGRVEDQVGLDHRIRPQQGIFDDRTGWHSTGI